MSVGTRNNDLLKDECVFCLGSLSHHDKQYPLLCPSKCGCNLCFNCTSHLVKMRKQKRDDMTLCPRCQNDLSLTIEDTFLMRKVLQMEETLRTTSSTTGIKYQYDVPDFELSAAELRFKNSTTEQDIENAKSRLFKFKQDIDNGNVSPRSSPSRKNKVAENIKFSTALEPPTIPKNPPQFIDYALFDGMQDVLSEAEQIFISELMTSGDVEKLVQAAQIIFELKIMPSHNETGSTDNDNSNKIKDQSRLTDAEKRAVRMALPDEERIQLEQIDKHYENHPLPRMPKFVMMNADFDIYARHGKVLKFRDDVWDGSISDAFSRVYTTTGLQSTSQDSSSLGDYDSFEGQHDSYGEGGFINGSSKKVRNNHVLVYAARKDAAKLGVEEGDVVTHFDGNEFLGNANDLKVMIHNIYVMGNGNSTFSMVLNAEQSTADALKDRALIDDSWQ